MAIDALVHGERANTVLGWTRTVVVAVAAVERFLTNAYLWAGLALLFVFVASLPAVVTGSPTAMVP